MPILKAKRITGDYGLTITDVAGNSMNIDIPEEQGGNGNGLRPMQTILAALLGCCNVDVVAILKKQRQEITNIEIEVDGEREQNKEPSVWQNVNLVFKIDGKVEPDKAYRAVQLSLNKYCSVAETLRRAGAVINFKIYVNNEEIK